MQNALSLTQYACRFWMVGPLVFAGHAEQIENIDAVEQVQAKLVVERGWIGA
jgi:hypothetical protein